MKLIRFCISLLLFLAAFPAIAQNRAIDSLTTLIGKSSEDTNRIKLLQELARQYNTEEQTKKAHECLNRSMALCVKLGYKKGEFVCYNVRARSYQVENEYPKAVECYLKALKIAEQRNDAADIGITYQRIASMHVRKGNYSESIDPLTKALAIYRKLSDSKQTIAVHLQLAQAYEEQKKFGMAAKEYEMGVETATKAKDTADLAVLYEQMGNLYTHENNFEQALHYHKASLDASKSLADDKGVADSYSDIGDIYLAQKKYREALENHLSALDLYKKCADDATIAASHMYVGQVYMRMDQEVKAIDSHFSALTIASRIGDKTPLPGIIYLSLGDVYLNSKEYDKAMDCIYKVVEIAKTLRNETMLKNCYRKLSEIAIKKQDYKSAYGFQKLFAETLDSIYTSYNMEDKQVRELQEQFEEEKKANEKKLHEAQIAHKESELKQASTIRFALIAGLILILLFSGFIYNRFKLTQRQKETITLQKEMVEQKRQETESQKLVIEHKQKEIIESISYAKRLQEAILPPADFVNKYAPENFILYKPKDLVAGDFYWAEHIGDKFFIAAADSTGHGVPGAMVSVVCSNALNRTIKEFKEKEPGKILDKTRELVLETFEKSENDVKDGMDISLLCIDKKHALYWSGANNPLWFIHDKKLHEIKADKQPIGKTDLPKPFVTHEIAYAKGSVFYLFTDGFADQFGGPKGKKFKYKQLEDTFMEIHQQPMNEQSALLSARFDNWKGNLEQVDDVCIIGIRL